MDRDDSWERLLAPIRFGQNAASKINFDRTPFVKDYDRIIFSSSFRRLSKKNTSTSINTK